MTFLRLCGAGWIAGRRKGRATTNTTIVRGISPLVTQPRAPVRHRGQPAMASVHHSRLSGITVSCFYDMSRAIQVNTNGKNSPEMPQR